MIPEIEALLEKAQQSLQAAEALQADSYFNFAASRLYYAMFYIAQALLLGDQLSFSKHSAVIAAFGQHLAKTQRVPPHFHRWLIEGQDIRNIGDYDIESELSEAQTEEQLRRAACFVDLAEQLLGPLPPN